mgnify:FL=1
MNNYRTVSYIISSKRYNKNNNCDTVYFNTKTILLRKQGMNTNFMREWDNFRYSKIDQMKYNYETYYFTKKEGAYNTIIKNIKREIETANANLNTRAFQQEQNKLENKASKYTIVSNEHQKFLHDIFYNYNDVKLTKIDELDGKDREAVETTTELFNNYKTKNPTKKIHKRIKLSDQERIENMRVYYQNNKEKIKDKQKEYVEDNRSKINEQSRIRLYKKNLKKHFTDEEIKQHETTVISILESDIKKGDKINKLVDIINTNNNIRIIISSKADKSITLAITNRLHYLKLKKLNK